MTKLYQKEIYSLPAEGFVRLPQVLSVLPISKTSFWMGVKEWRFPKPVKLGPRTSAWRVEEIRALIENFSNRGADDYDK